MVEDLSYEALMNRWRREKSSPTLQRLDPTFYSSVEEKLRELQEEFQKEVAQPTPSPKAIILQDEIRNLQRARDDLYDLRERKIALAALAAARGGSPDRSGMTRAEQDLFESLLKSLREARRNILRGIEIPKGSSPSEPPPPPTLEPTTQAPEAPLPTPSERGPEPRVLVRALERIEPFVASDLETYELDAEDVALLPQDTAMALVRHKKAELLPPA